MRENTIHALFFVNILKFSGMLESSTLVAEHIPNASIKGVLIFRYSEMYGLLRLINGEKVVIFLLLAAVAGRGCAGYPARHRGGRGGTHDRVGRTGGRSLSNLH
jgi:hypothetical protein